MKLSENPIFLTHKRLVHRSGVLAAVLIAGMIGLSLLLGLVESLREGAAHNFGSPQDSGKGFYGWVIGIEILVVVLGGFSRVSRALSEDRKAGLWDSNRLTPLKPAQIVAGYWFAPALREFYMAVVLAVFGLIITLVAGLPITLWLGTQTLIASTALFFGLIGILAGMAFQRSQGILIFLVLLISYPFSFIAPSRMIGNFLLPIYGIGNLFSDAATGSYRSNHDWGNLPEVFGLAVPPVVLSLGLQFIIGIFIWRALVRKTANPFQPLLLRWEAVVLFSILVLTQHSLLWDLWRGSYPNVADNTGRSYDHEALLSVVHGGSLLIGLILLACASAQPEHVRVESLRLGFKNLGAIFARSAVSLALVLAGIAGAGLLLQVMGSLQESYQILAVVVVNVLEIFLVVALLLEFCRLRHKRRALGFVALWLFVLCVIPFILAGVLRSENLARVSLLAPGFFALADESDQNWQLLFCTLLAHFGVVVLLFIGWQRQWKRLLERAG
ncbi:MAG: hypothetical protein P4N60_10455 [Verrucomicrobiae bacterium]|nr:hypothetical protein [Verrucomicrobiae bacterium]